MTNRSCMPRFIPVFLALTFILWQRHAEAQSQTLATLMPPGAVAYVEFSELGPVITRFQNSNFLRLILESQQYGEFRETGEYRKANAVRQILETQLGMDLWSVGKKLLGKRIAVSTYSKPGQSEFDFVAVIQVLDRKTMTRLRERIEPVLVLIEDQIQRFNSGKGLERIEANDKAYFAIDETRIVATNNRDLFDESLALLSNEGGSSLAEDETFQMMVQQTGIEHVGKVFLNAGALAEATGGRFGYPEKLDNAVASLLFSGIMELVVRSPYAGLTLDVESDHFLVTGEVSGDQRDLGDSYAPFFSEFPKTGVLPIPTPPELIGGFSIYRDFAGWYSHREELLQAKVLPAFDQFESGLGNLLPGRDFEQDVLSLIGNTVSFVAARQDFSHLDGKPGVQLPGFAVIIDLAKPEEGSEMFQLFFQTLSSILNIQAGQQGRQPWILNAEVRNGVNITSGRYLKKPSGERLPLVFNFMPASARIGDRFIISSSLSLCRELIDALQAPASAKPENKNFNIDLSLGPLAEILQANQETLQAQRIEQGRSSAEARQEIEIAIKLLQHFKSINLSTIVADGRARLQLRGNWQ